MTIWQLNVISGVLPSYWFVWFRIGFHALKLISSHTSLSVQNRLNHELRDRYIDWSFSLLFSIQKYFANGYSFCFQRFIYFCINFWQKCLYNQKSSTLTWVDPSIYSWVPVLYILILLDYGKAGMFIMCQAVISVGKMRHSLSIKSSLSPYDFSNHGFFSLQIVIHS